MTEQERLQQIWRQYHEISRLNRYQRNALDSLEVLIHQLEQAREQVDR